MSTLNGYDALAVANYFITLAAKDGVPLDPMKLQKLVYLAHGWSLALRGRPLVRQTVEAWPYGPVIRQLYNEFSDFRAAPITLSATTTETITDAGDIAFLREVWNTYKSFTGPQLSAMTHESGSAWDMATREHTGWLRPTIPNQLIADEFLHRQQRG